MAAFIAVFLIASGAAAPAGTALGQVPASASGECTALRAAVADLAATFGGRYPKAKEYLARLDAIESGLKQATGDQKAKLDKDLAALQREALVANPLVSGQPMLFVVRAQYAPDHHSTETMFQNSEVNTGSFHGPGALKAIRFGADGNAIDSRTLVDVPKGIVRDPDVNFDGQRIVFSMRKDIADDYHVYQINADGTGLKQLTWGTKLSDIDPIYLADGRIAFSSTRDVKYCQCNRHIMPNLFVMQADGANPIQIGGNDLTELHASLMPDGRILYDRWEYVDRQFGPSFGLWTVNPDGTNHALYYGNNAWTPGAIVDARVIPGSEQVVCIFGSCHDRPWGAMTVIDRRLGLDGPGPAVRMWPASAKAILGQGNNAAWEPDLIDAFTGVRPRYEDPYPLSGPANEGAGKYFLVSRTVDNNELMGVFLVDVFGNELLLHVEGPGCYNAMPLAPRPRPIVISDRTDLARSGGMFYLQDAYAGTGMESVKPGTIKYLRIVEAPPKRYWADQGGGIDAAQIPVMNWNTVNNKAVIGDVPVEADGSAYFTAPAGKFLYFQALDKDKMMVQSMRSGTMVRPGEAAGCAGCHENRLASAPNRPRAAWKRPPSAPQPWYGPTREFNYLTEVQPVFDRNCIRCHDYGTKGGAKLILVGDVGLQFNASYVELEGKSPVRWFPDDPNAPKALVKAVQDGPPAVLGAYAWGSHRSRLVDVIRSGHSGVKLSKEDFERVVTWIDLNTPYYGSYMSAYPGNAFGRSPLTGAQWGRLAELVKSGDGPKLEVGSGPQISLTRPERSPILSAFKDKNDPKYKEALAILQAGKDQLARQPREDMLGPAAKPVTPRDLERAQRYAQQLDWEARARQALAAGGKVYPYRPE